jgi:hypothetical protein
MIDALSPAARVAKAHDRAHLAARVMFITEVRFFA